jgi:hypothetical protein
LLILSKALSHRINNIKLANALSHLINNLKLVNALSHHLNNGFSTLYIHDVKGGVRYLPSIHLLSTQMSNFNISSPDIDPEESISQISGSLVSTTTSSRAIAGSTSQTLFLSHFHLGGSEFQHGDEYMVIQNDPATLERARMILGVKAVLYLMLIK